MVRKHLPGKLILQYSRSSIKFQSVSEQHIFSLNYLKYIPISVIRLNAKNDNNANRLKHILNFGNRKTLYTYIEIEGSEISATDREKNTFKK